MVVAALAQASAPAQEPLRLAHRWAKGDVAVYRATFEQDARESEASSQSSTFRTKQVVRDVSREGIATLDLTYEAVRVRIGPRGGAPDFAFDSESPTTQPSQSAAYARAFGALVGAGYSARVDSSGRVLGIEGAEAMFRRVSEAIGGEAVSGLLAQFHDAFDAEHLRTRMEMSGVVLPPAPIARGGSWTRECDLVLPSGASSHPRVESRFEGVEPVDGQPCARIESTWRIPAERASETKVPGVGTVRIDLEATSGEYRTWFSVDAGYPVRVAGKLPLEMVVSTRGDAEPPPGRVARQHVEQTISVDLVSLQRALR
ncbi:MAG TPA: DUF6263 family protein [Planctomycetota bacterium]|nr:DUF6263 family protein [Planctomycetota bacterium]